MHSLLAYTVQVNLFLAISCLGYFFLLRSLTFYHLNRFYLLVGVGFALIYPFMDIRNMFKKHIAPVGEIIEYLPRFEPVQAGMSGYTLENLVYVLLGLGVLFFSVRLCFHVSSLWRIHRNSTPDVWQNYLFRNVLFPIVPFSFLNKIYIHKEQHQEDELLNVFEHETIHVRGKHSIDIIIYEMVLIACWYNPFVWLMRRAVRQNLEFLTDQLVLERGIDRQMYQYSLLKVSKEGSAVNLGHQFNFKRLKKRITMMNKKRSKKLELSKYVFLLPFLIFAASAFTVGRVDRKIIEVMVLAKETELLAPTEVKKDTVTVVNLSEQAEQGLIKAVSLVTDAKEGLTRADSMKDIIVSGYKSDNLERHSRQLNIAQVGNKVETESLANKSFMKLTISNVNVKPLVVVDGVEQFVGYDLSAIKPGDIKSISIIKGANAVFLHGTDAKGGVIYIVTKDSDLAKDTVDVGGWLHPGKEDRVRVEKDKATAPEGKTTVLAESLTGITEQTKGASSLLDHIKIKKSESEEKNPITFVKGEVSVVSYKGDAKKSVLLTRYKGKEEGTLLNIGDDDVLLVDGQPVSKNDFKKALRKKKGSVLIEGKDKGRVLNVISKD